VRQTDGQKPISVELKVFRWWPHACHCVLGCRESCAAYNALLGTVPGTAVTVCWVAGNHVQHVRYRYHPVTFPGQLSLCAGLPIITCSIMPACQIPPGNVPGIAEAYSVCLHSAAHLPGVHDEVDLGVESTGTDC